MNPYKPNFLILYYCVSLWSSVWWCRAVITLMFFIVDLPEIPVL
jgi:hypothetical protein